MPTDPLHHFSCPYNVSIEASEHCAGLSCCLENNVNTPRLQCGSLLCLQPWKLAALSTSVIRLNFGPFVEVTK